MQEKQVLERAFAMPLTSPAYPSGPYRFVNREYLIITYRTDRAKLRAVVPEPLELDEREALVKYEFIRMPDSNGFGDYTESGQVIPVSFRGRKGGYTHCMFLNDEGPIAGGRELWGFPKKLAQPTLRTEIDTLIGTLDYGPLRVATGTMGYKHREADLAQVKGSLAAPNFLLKIIPHVDGSPRICELVEYHLEDVTMKGAWTGPAALHLSPHALAPVAELPVLEIVSAIHILADLTLGLGEVVHDYLRQPSRQALRINEMALATWAPILSQGGFVTLLALMALRRSAVDVTAVPEPLKRTAWDYDRTWWAPSALEAMLRAALDLNLLEEQIGEECATLYDQAPQIAMPPCIVSDIAQLPSTQAKSPFPALAQAVGSGPGRSKMLDLSKGIDWLPLRHLVENSS